MGNVQKPGTLIGIYVTIAEYDALKLELIATLERAQKAEAELNKVIAALEELDYSIAFWQDCFHSMKLSRDEARTWARKLYHSD